MTKNERPVRAEVAKILKRSVCLTLWCEYLGNDRKVRLADVIDAVHGDQTLDDRTVRATKKLIDRKRLTAVTTWQGKAKSYLRSQAITAHRVFGERTYLIPLALVEEVDGHLVEFEARVRAEAQQLATDYAAEIEKQRAALGVLFRAADYKQPSEVAVEFALRWEYVSFAAPERLETVDRALFERARRRYETKMTEAYEEVRIVLRETLSQVTSDLVKKLTPGDDGKPRMFRNSILDGLDAFLGSFEARNIADDDELAAVVKRLRRLTKGLDPQQLREAETVRASVLAEVRQATDRLDALVATGRRGIQFGPLTAA